MGGTIILYMAAWKELTDSAGLRQRDVARSKVMQAASARYGE